VYLADDDELAWRIDLDFDQEGRLVGVEFENARGQLPLAVLKNLMP
jgi:uncharacterized protein YuzE